MFRFDWSRRVESGRSGRSGRERYLYQLGWPVSLPCWLYGDLYLCLVLHLLYTSCFSFHNFIIQYSTLCMKVEYTSAVNG